MVEDYLGAMKTNPSARGIRKLRRVLGCFAIALIAGCDLWVGAMLVGGLGQPTAYQTDSPAGPSVTIGEVMAAAR